MATQVDALMARARRLLHDHRTRAREVGLQLDYSLSDLRRLLESNPLCHWCKLPVDFALTLDHLHPIARGGQHALHNLCVSCTRCNALRGMLTEAETLELLEFLGSLPPLARQDLERRLLAGGQRYQRRRRHD